MFCVVQALLQPEVTFSVRARPRIEGAFQAELHDRSWFSSLGSVGLTLQQCLLFCKSVVFFPFLPMLALGTTPQMFEYRKFEK